MTDQPGTGPVPVDPVLVLRKVQQGSELGAALVRAAAWEVQAEQLGAEVDALRRELAATRTDDPDAPSDGAPS